MVELTERETEILRLIADGLSNREIAQELVLSLGTVKWYARQIYNKLGVHSRTQAVAQAREAGLLDTQPDVPARPAVAPKHNLPAQVTSFVGREREIAQVKQLLGTARLLTLTGPPGTGKTRLALQIAAALLHEFAGGTYFVELAPIRDPDLVDNTIAKALGIQGGHGQPTAEALKAHLRTKRVLLLLDNFEHIVQAAPLVAELLAAAPSLKALVTSREVLHVSGEHEFPVPPLAIPDPKQSVPLEVLSQYEAVALFFQRAQAVRPDFDLTDDNAAAVAKICVRLDGLPLAIELAAARSKLFAPQVLLDQLGDRLETLTGGMRELPERQRAMRATIDWSYDLLDVGEKTLFEWLGVFVGGCTLEAAKAICNEGLPMDVIDGVESLLNKSLLRRVEGPEHEPRLTMLGTLRAYALERLVDSGNEEVLRRRHAEHYLSLAEQGDLELRGANHNEWMDLLEIEHDNFRVALEWSSAGADPKLGLQLAGALGRFWWLRGQLLEGYRRTARALEGGADAPPAVRARALNSAGWLAANLGDHTQGRVWNEEALALFRELGDKRNMAWARLFLGQHLVQTTGHPDRFAALAGEALAVFRELDDKDGTARALSRLGEMARLREEPEQAKTFHEESLALYRELDITHFIGVQLQNLGYVARALGDIEGMQALFKECLAVPQDQWTSAHALMGLAGAASLHGQPERAAWLFGAGQAFLESIGFRIHASDAPDIERTLAAVRAQLEEAEFEALLAEGRAMALEEAIAYALAEGDA
jgi:predicted ATPase/DNA-binding CsgD family transcriptional regulator